MTDLITIVDKYDRVIGSEERKLVYQKGLIHRLIRILLFNKKNEVLLQWRSPNEDTFPNTWDQSVGGHVDKGESYIQAAKRELNEELGITNVDLKYIDKYFTSGTIGKKIIARYNAVYFGFFEGNKFVLQENEVEEVIWVKVEEVYKLLNKDRNIVTDGLMTIFERYEDRIIKYSNRLL